MLKGNKRFLWDLQGPDEMGEDGKAAAANPAMPGADPGLSSPRPLLRHGSAPGTQSLARALVAEAWCRPVQWMSIVVYSRSPVELRHLRRRRARRPTGWKVISLEMRNCRRVEPSWSERSWWALAALVRRHKHLFLRADVGWGNLFFVVVAVFLILDW
jgi:hypothetical protein